MPIITKTSSPVKGSPTVFILNKSDLATLPIVAADSYFSQTSNWKEVILIYKSSIGSQYEILRFDASLVSPTAVFEVSLKARDSFEIQAIKIRDFDGGWIEAPRSVLTVADFDVSLAAPSEDNYILLEDLEELLLEDGTNAILD